MNKLVKNYIYNVLYQIFLMIVPLITVPYLARTLHPENIGIYSYVTSCASIISSIGTLGFYSYGNRQTAYIRDNKNELNQILNELLSIRLILCALSTIVYFGVGFSSEYRIYFIIYYPWLLAGFIDISWFFSGIEDMGPMVFKNSFIRIINILVIFVFIRSENDLGKYFFGVASGILIANSWMYLQLKKKKIKISFSLRNCKEHIVGAIQLFLPQVASLFYLQVDKVMLKHLLDNASQLAFYDQAEKIVSVPLSVVTALGAVMMPRIANEFKKENWGVINNYITKSFKFAMMLCVPIMFGMCAIADNLIPWYLGKEYFQVIQAVWIISPIIITNAMINISGTQYLMPFNKVKVLTCSNILAAVMNIIVNFLLIPRLKFYGAAIATIVSSVSCVMVQYYSMNKTIKVISLFLETWKYFLFAAVMFFILRIVGRSFSTTIYSTGLMIIIGVLIYFLLLLCSKDSIFISICHVIKSIIKKKGK